MSEPAARNSAFDLDEFERRLRAAPKNFDGQDPLAELARLVGGEKGADPFEALFRAQNAAQAIARDARQFDQADQYRGDFSGPSVDHVGNFAEEPPFYGEDPQWLDHRDEPAQPGRDAPQWLRHDATPAAPARGGGAILLMAVVLGVGVIGIGAGLVWRGGAHKQVATISAEVTPTKVQPAASENATDSAQGQALFDRKDAAPVARVVSNQEQPADLASTPKPPRVIAMSGGAASVAVPAAPEPTGAQANSQAIGQGAPSGDSLFPAPKKVKTVSVRADGTPISEPTGQPPLAGSPFGSAPPPSLAPKSATPKVTQRIATPASGGADTTAHARPKVAHNAAVSPAEPANAGAGGFAVQLAISPSELEARSAANSLSTKYSSALGGRYATFVKATVGDKMFYRVRVGHLTKEAAGSICASVKAQGGNCFPTKN